MTKSDPIAPSSPSLQPPPLQAVPGRFELGDFELLSGERLENAFLAYATLGTLDADKSNAVLFPSWYSGDLAILESAWTGPGRALDPDKYFIILVNQLGGGLSASPSNAAPAQAGRRFPKLAIGDDARAQHRLIAEKFGIERLALVVGGSMGAQQAYDLAVRFPQAVARAAPIAGTARATPHAALLVSTFIAALDDADRAKGLARHARLFAALGFTPELYDREAFLALGFATQEEFLHGFVEAHFAPLDPDDLRVLLEKWRAADVAAGGDLKAALEKIEAKTVVLAIEEDGFFPLADFAAEAEFVPGAELRRLSSIFGHLALFGLDSDFNAAVDAHLKTLLDAPAPRLEDAPAATEAPRPPIDPYPLSDYVAWAGNRNKGPILSVFREIFPKTGAALEIASGSGLHVTHFAPHFPGLSFQPSDYDERVFDAIRKKRDDGALAHVADPIRIDLNDPASWPDASQKLYDAIFVINIFQVAPLSVADGLFGLGAKLLTQDGLVAIYGPFKVDGGYTTPSNAAFDGEILSAGVAEWGLKDVRDLARAAQAHGLVLKRRIDAPANNFILVFGRP